jgi:hypothetical protein
MALLRYTILRVLVFLATAGVLWLLGLRGLWLALIAILLSGFVSIVVLSRSRDAASIALSEGLSRTSLRQDQAADTDGAREDAGAHDDPVIDQSEPERPRE